MGPLTPGHGLVDWAATATTDRRTAIPEPGEALGRTMGASCDTLAACSHGQAAWDRRG